MKYSGNTTKIFFFTILCLRIIVKGNGYLKKKPVIIVT